jgi:alpha-L-rhamnosidase
MKSISNQSHNSVAPRRFASKALRCLACPLFGFALGFQLHAQNTVSADQLDPARDNSRLFALAQHHPLAEEYIWIGTDRKLAERKDEVQGAQRWLFRRVFSLASVPAQSTLYVAASGDVEVWLNGTQLLNYSDDYSQRAGYTVHAIDPGAALHADTNVLAISVHQLHGAHHTTTDPLILQFVGGRALAVKLVPAARGVDKSPLMVSDGTWQGCAVGPATLSASSLRTISSASYDSSNWPAVTSLGTIESNIAFFQWNADAGMYSWPGYVGASSYLRHFVLKPMKATSVYTGSAVLEGIDRLADSQTLNTDAFTVHLSPLSSIELSPALTLDFGRELEGRIHLRSASDKPILVSTAYGESEEEALHEPFLGERSIYIPPHGEAWGPKSGFRYVRLRFLSDARLSAIDADGITYPVEYKGAFNTSDTLLNRIWQTGAYTAHLCMQDGIWDGVKRDRARWAGDLNVISRVTADVFADRDLVEETYMQLIEETQDGRHVNGIPGYSALWISGVADFYRNSGDRAFIERIRPSLLSLLRTMGRDIEPNGLFAPQSGEQVFVDWSPGLSTDTAEARRATEFEFLLAYNDAVWLLDELGDDADASQLKTRYERLRVSARTLLMDSVTHVFGATWQTNAMAVLSGAATPEDYPHLWANIFSKIDDVSDSSPTITPYYGFYVLEALARLGHRTEALKWMRDFWGGMIAEGATTFWESYDPRWTKRNFHSGLQADGLTGYYVSLAHGWSSGPTAWLSEQVLGIRAIAAGFRTATIQPELSGLQWAEGSVPTPNGLIHLRVENGKIALDLPNGVIAAVLVPSADHCPITVNGATTTAHGMVSGETSITIDHPGHSEIDECFNGASLPNTR